MVLAPCVSVKPLTLDEPCPDFTDVWQDPVVSTHRLLAENLTDTDVWNASNLRYFCTM